MKKLFIALTLAVILTVAFTTPAFAGGPPDNKDLPDGGYFGVLVACAAGGLNQPSLYKPNPGLSLPWSVKFGTIFELIASGPPIAWGYWCNKS